MRVIRNFHNAAGAGAPQALTIGNFDGVHLGHQHLIARLRQAADARDITAAVMTFEPHPLAVLAPGKPLYRLGACRDKLRLLMQCGVDVARVVKFTKALANMTADDFADYLFGALNTRHLIVGENFRFGKGGAGDVTLLTARGEKFGATVAPAPLLAVGGAVASSGAIRQRLGAGEFTAAAQLLGRPWQMRGKVRRGAGRGRQWGIPTANIALPYTPPLRGIYAALARAGAHCHAAALSIGNNPTIANAAPSIEAHLLDFSGDLYGEWLTIEPLKKLRDEIKFNSTDELVAAMRQDIEDAKVIAGARLQTQARQAQKQTQQTEEAKI